MNKKEQNLPSIVCPVCLGTGRSERGFSCSNCAGMGLGSFFQGRFYFWGLKMGRAVIELNYLRNKIRLIINFVTYAIGLAGFLGLVFWGYLSTQESSDLSALYFWQQRHGLILFFWISLLADMFVLFRLSEEARKKHRIKSYQYDSSLSRANSPNNWDELKQAKKRIRVDVYQGYDPKATEVIEQAYLLTVKLSHREVTPLHLFFCCLGDTQVAAILTRLNVDIKKLSEKLKEQISKLDDVLANSEGVKVDFSAELKEVFIEAYLNASRLGQKKVTAKNLIIPCLDKNQNLEDILFDMEVDRNKIYNVILWFIINERLLENYRVYRQKARFKPGGNMDRAYTSVATPILNHFAYDLTAAAKWGKLDFCVARDEEINKIWQNFESGSSGIILVGPPGVGKKTVISGIAQLMVKEDVPKFLRDKRLLELDAARLISGADASAAQGRLLAIIDEVVRAGNIILYIKDVENLGGITSGGEQSMDLAEVLASALERRAIYCLASATVSNYTKYIENQSLGKEMAKVVIKEPEGNQAIQIIESKISYFESKYKVYFSYNAIEQVLKLSERYVHDKYIPEKAINILELVANRVAKTKGEQAIVTDDDIAQSISELTGIPVTEVSATEGKKLLDLEQKIHERMINQVQAVEAVASSLRRARTQLREGKRPIANFLFLGPTGVGKTELAKTVSEIYFGNEKYMIRVDMSEYQHPDSIKKMIGDASGAKGYLTEAVRKSPFSLILLDEVEKAHPDILNLFLQVMDDGRLTDGQGRTIDFTSSILIATSNAGALYIQEQVRAGTDIEEIEEVLINEHLNKVMRPELINRFDGVVVFKPLTLENVTDIARLMLNKIGKMLEEKGISLELEEEGVRQLAELGYDPKFGARPLRRLLQDKIENAIANKILSGELTRRDVIVINKMAEVEIKKGREI